MRYLWPSRVGSEEVLAGQEALVVLSSGLPLDKVIKLSSLHYKRPLSS